MKKLFFAAVLLLCINVFANATTISPVLVKAETSFLNQNNSIDSDIISILIEDYAAPHWKISIEAAWEAYFNGSLTIRQSGPNTYVLSMEGGGALTVLLEGHI